MCMCCSPTRRQIAETPSLLLLARKKRQMAMLVASYVIRESVLCERNSSCP